MLTKAQTRAAPSEKYCTFGLAINMTRAVQHKAMNIEEHTMRVSNTDAAFAHNWQFVYEKKMDSL